MSNDLINPSNEPSRHDRFQDWSNDQIIEETRKRMSLCARSLLELAEIVGAACRRGIDLHDVMNPELLNELRKIDCGQIAPELAERFMHERVYRRLRVLPLDDQKRIATTGKVGLVVRRGNAFDFRMMEVVALSTEQAKLVFDNGRIRSREEMITILENDEPKPEEVIEKSTLLNLQLEIPLTATQQRQLKQKAMKAGSMSAFVQQAILKLL